MKDQIQFHRFLQFKFFEQWSKLRRYANHKGIQIIGDVSIYVCHNSADVWANAKLFKLDPQTLEPAYIHLPHHYIQNCVVYPGTHDNDTALVRDGRNNCSVVMGMGGHLTFTPFPISPSPHPLVPTAGLD